jgi:hypothetical protein
MATKKRERKKRKSERETMRSKKERVLVLFAERVAMDSVLIEKTLRSRHDLTRKPCRPSPFC